jgi:hypothetical protein
LRMLFCYGSVTALPAGHISNAHNMGWCAMCFTAVEVFACKLGNQ